MAAPAFPRGGGRARFLFSRHSRVGGNLFKSECALKDPRVKPKDTA